MKRLAGLISILVIGTILAGCATMPSAKNPSGVKQDLYPIPPYATALKGQKICLDPGHGGDADMKGYKRGPTGLQEAEVNLRVALDLKDFLEQAGVQVYMTRTTDVLVRLDQISYFANTCGAEYFVSLHHNASSSPATNFTSTWYHDSPDYGPLNLDLARYIGDGVANALNMSQRTPIPLKSDFYIYPGQGFAVLRNTKIPATLCEATFHSNPQEEQRLRDPVYNKREAYGYFIGLAKFFYSGIPKAVVTAPEKTTYDRQPKVTIKVNDGLKGQLILADSIVVKVDGKPVPSSYDRSSGLITASIDSPLANNYHTVLAQFMNLNKTSVYPNPYTFQVIAPVKSLEVKTSPANMPNDGESRSAIIVTAKDGQGNIVADGTPVDLKSSNGTLTESRVTTVNGIALSYLVSSADTGIYTVTAQSEDVMGASAVSVQSTKYGFLWGEIYDAHNGNPVEHALLEITSIVDRPFAYSLRDGTVLLEDIPHGNQWLLVTADGYEPLKINLPFESDKTVRIRFDLIKR